MYMYTLLMVTPQERPAAIYKGQVPNKHLVWTLNKGRLSV